MVPLSSIATSAYTDLVRLLNDDAVSGIQGKLLRGGCGGEESDE